LFKIEINADHIETPSATSSLQVAASFAMALFSSWSGGWTRTYESNFAFSLVSQTTDFRRSVTFVESVNTFIQSQGEPGVFCGKKSPYI
jgi:hypothetical protein